MRTNLILKNIAATLCSCAVICGFAGALAQGAESGAAGNTATGALPAEASPGKAWSEVVARVNGQPITRGEVDRTIRIYLAQSRASHELSPEARKQAEESALEQLIGNRLLYQVGLKLEIRDLEQQVADKLLRFKPQLGTVDDAASGSNELTEQGARELVRTDIVVRNLLESGVVSKVTVPESDIRDFYQQNLKKFTKPESVRLSHILFEADPQGVPEEKRKARANAEIVRDKILGGADFAALAKTWSSCPSKEQGGELGSFTKGEMVPEFEKGTASLKAGEISEVVETRFGYHILRVEERTDAVVEKYQDAREKILDYLKQERIVESIKDYVTGLKEKAKIEIVAKK
jgi:peptidyl-prolyl cis-trans isomerase C